MSLPPHRELRILGLDPGLATTGWGAVSCDGNHVRYLDSGLVTTKRQDSLPVRLRVLHAALSAVLLSAQASEVALESVFLGKNPQSAFAVGQARAAALLAVQDRPCSEYSPRTVKKAVTASGSADKTQVRRMIARLLPESPKNLTCHASDALAVALCHAFTQRANSIWTNAR